MSGALFVRSAKFLISSGHRRIATTARRLGTPKCEPKKPDPYNAFRSPAVLAFQKIESAEKARICAIKPPIKPRNVFRSPSVVRMLCGNIAKTCK